MQVLFLPFYVDLVGNSEEPSVWESESATTNCWEQMAVCSTLEQGNESSV